MAKSRAQPTKERRADERKDQILRALHKCIRTKGFTKSSLTDIAVEAGMSPSHIRYYFEGKDAILEHYLDQTCSQILESIHAIDTDDPDEWFRNFVKFFIGNPWITPGRMSVAMEIFGISVHDDRLRRIKATYDVEIRRILENYFRKVGCAKGLTARDAAEIVQALEAGMKFNTVFQDGYDTDRARKLFVASVRALTGARAP
jgi:AcrR family transcriptional regulator